MRRQCRGERDDDFVKRIALKKRVHRASENWDAGKRLKLLGLCTAKPGTAAARSDDCRYVQAVRIVDSIDPDQAPARQLATSAYFACSSSLMPPSDAIALLV